MRVNEWSVIGVFVVALSACASAVGVELKAPGVEDAILVSLPENHDPSKSWPAVFSYHGFNGKPETRTTRSHIGPKDWIVIGMGYTQKGRYQVGPEDIANELKAFRYVRDELARTQGLDPKRVFVTGYSKGGWMTDSLLQAAPDFAGGAILMGGHIPSALKNAPVQAKSRSIFIGVGRLDPNHLPSLEALLYYRGLGLQTSFEAWSGLAHDFPREGSVGLREWYVLQNGGKPDEAALEEEFAGFLKGPAMDAWSGLTALQERPFFNVAGSAWPERITKELERLGKDAGVDREAKIRMTHRQLLARELKMKTLEELRQINTGYLKLSGVESVRSPEIEHDHRRIMAVLKNTEAAVVRKPAVVVPEPPKDERAIPKNPLLR
jgi:predicted esterase